MGAGYKVLGSIVAVSVLAVMATSVSAQELPTPPAHVLDVPVNQAVVAAPNAIVPVQISPQGVVEPQAAPSYVPQASLPVEQKVVALPAANAPVRGFQVSGTELQSDGLHKDPRWPQFRNCIDHTDTPQAFEACLQQAFMTDTTGMTAALLPK